MHRARGVRRVPICGRALSLVRRPLLQQQSAAVQWRREVSQQRCNVAFTLLHVAARIWASEHVCWCTDLYFSSKVRWCNDDERWVRSRRRRHWPCCMLRHVPATICSGAPTLYFRKKTWRSLRVSNTWLCRRDEQYIEIKTFWSSRKDRVILITIYLSAPLYSSKCCIHCKIVLSGK